MTKKSTYQHEYSKQLKRIKSFIKRTEKRGYFFSENAIPKKPKNITQQSVNVLKKLTPEKLYKKAKYAGELSFGEIVSSKKGLQLERKSRGQKIRQIRKYKLQTPTQEPTNTAGFEPPENISEDVSFFDNVVISGFRVHVSQFNERSSTLLLNWLNKILQTNNLHDVATMLNDGAEAGNIVTYQIVYSSDKLYQYMSNMLDYLPEASTLFKEEMMEAMEEEESYES